MGGWGRPLIIKDCLDARVVKFSNSNHWQLTKKISEKACEGTDEEERKEDQDDWQPHEEHAVFECKQVRGSRVGHMAIMKIRLDNDAKERAKDASGMRINGSTRNEIKVLQRLTAARCSATPALLASKIDVQDESVLNSRGKPRFENEWGKNRQWWMPGGYVVYILMSRLDAQPLDTNVYWDFERQQRDEVRSAFKDAYL
ncbi:MAG: hypothetical protein Q9183_007225 [Haloplaca sp. 2 TL-2023]